MKDKTPKTAKEIEIENNLKKLNYPASDDIYNKGKEETAINPEDVSKKKSHETVVGKMNDEPLGTIKTGVDLDVPGSELDDQQENIGSEDEENNYYSQADTKTK